MVTTVQEQGKLIPGHYRGDELQQLLSCVNEYECVEWTGAAYCSARAARLASDTLDAG